MRAGNARSVVAVVALAALTLTWLRDTGVGAQEPRTAPSTVTPLKASLYRDGWIDLNKNGRLDPYETPSLPVERRIDDLLAQMTLEEKTVQLATLYGFARVLKDPLPTAAWKSAVWKHGIANIDEHLNGVRDVQDPNIGPPSVHARAMNEVQRFFIEETRLGIPADFTNEGVHGLCYRKATNFPSPVAIGATFNRDLVSEIGAVVAREARAVGYTNIYSPILDLARDPRWGRVVDDYSEDPFLVAELGVRQARALQKGGVGSTLKHFAVYSIPKGGRDGLARTDPGVAPREMETLFLRPFERVIREASPLGVMSSYNDYDGVPVSGSREMLIDRLRKGMGFLGYVVSDSDAVAFLFSKHRVAESPKDAIRMFIEEGGNVRTEFNPPENFVLPLRELVREGRLPMATIDARVRDVLRVKFMLGMFDRPYVEDAAAADRIVHSEAHRAVALRAARESIVLLKNQGGLLPLSKQLKRILVTGPNAMSTRHSLDRYGPNGSTVITVLEGIRAAVSPDTQVVYAKGTEIVDKRWPESEILPEPPSRDEARQIEEAVLLARDIDVIVAVLGESEDTIGESKSRTDLNLTGFQNDLVKALHATGKPIVAVLLNGRALTINWIDRNVPAIVDAWFGGEWTGRAVADVLFGDVNPGGRLPVTFPRTVGQVPFNFPYKPGSQVGQSRENDPNGVGNTLIEGALYPFGYGLSYTSFAYSDLSLTPGSVPEGGQVMVSVAVQNTGSRAGDEVVQLYLQDVVSSVTTYDKMLRGFERVSLQPGERKRVTFPLGLRDMELIDRSGRWVVEPGVFKVMVGASSTDIRLEADFTVHSSPPKVSGR